MERGIPSCVIQGDKQLAEERARSERILMELKESERILEILRTVSPVERKLDEPTITRWMALMAGQKSRGAIDLPFCEPVLSPSHPNAWFAKRFPEQIEKFGEAFFGGEHVDGLNEDAFAAILGSNARLCHQVVWFPDEKTFYFYDFRLDAFCPTTEEKLGLLTSQYLIRCAEDVKSKTAKHILRLRTPQNYKNVIASAKAMLAVNSSFFHGKDGKRRFVDGHYIEPDAIPSHELFVKKAFVRDVTGNLTVADAFCQYTRFCEDVHATPLTRAAFKDLVKEAIREEFQIRLRHDIVDSNSGRMTHGWRGITFNATRATHFSNN